MAAGVRLPAASPVATYTSASGAVVLARDMDLPAKPAELQALRQQLLLETADLRSELAAERRRLSRAPEALSRLSDGAAAARAAELAAQNEAERRREAAITAEVSLGLATVAAEAEAALAAETPPALREFAAAREDARFELDAARAALTVERSRAAAESVRLELAAATERSRRTFLETETAGLGEEFEAMRAIAEKHAYENQEAEQETQLYTRTARALREEARTAASQRASASENFTSELRASLEAAAARSAATARGDDLASRPVALAEPQEAHQSMLQGPQPLTRPATVVHQPDGHASHASHASHACQPSKLHQPAMQAVPIAAAPPVSVPRISGAYTAANLASDVGDDASLPEWAPEGLGPAAAGAAGSAGVASQPASPPATPDSSPGSSEVIRRAWLRKMARAGSSSATTSPSGRSGEDGIRRNSSTLSLVLGKSDSPRVSKRAEFTVEEIIEYPVTEVASSSMVMQGRETDTTSELSRPSEWPSELPSHLSDSEFSMVSPPGLGSGFRWGGLRGRSASAASTTNATSTKPITSIASRIARMAKPAKSPQLPHATSNGPIGRGASSTGAASRGPFDFAPARSDGSASTGSGAGPGPSLVAGRSRLKTGHWWPRMGGALAEVDVDADTDTDAPAAAVQRAVALSPSNSYQS